ncbi:hypothetical protein J6X04_01650 [Candidatus Saccharibacteria bacterium]|nr:hypothetical protein [Candidatus Saccharibacteria bacterium]
MSINITVKEKRTAIRKYYEGKYQKLIDGEYNAFIDAHQDGKGNVSRKFLMARIKFLRREKDRLLDELEQADATQVKKIYREIFK